MSEDLPLRLEWRTPAELADNPSNWREHPEAQTAALAGVVSEVGWAGAMLFNERTGRLIDGHARKKLPAECLVDGKVPVLIGDWSEEQERMILATLDPIGALAEANKDALGTLLAGIETESDAIQSMMEGLAADNGLDVFEEGNGEMVDPEPEMDRAAELQAEWGTELGQLWEIGPHRLLCGDSTNREDVERVMGEGRAVLVHADPPYGMGKEKDGVANDNLYREKLDAFQMAWWKASRPSVEDNGSAYIWGNAEDLWRLWYGGLKDSERVTFRNEIVWGKKGAEGIGAEGHRMYPTASERCLFFMLGEQGFNNNADNYWEGFEPIRVYLDGERKKCNWSTPEVAAICGLTETSSSARHWMLSSQWAFIPEEHYRKLQVAAREHDAFKREHDDLKREFYATRAYFDNTHENMTDVWEYPRVTGDERHEHPTPKPVEMVSRIIKTSSSDGALILDPFLGSGTTMVAAENLGRVCYGIELEPKYVAVALQRMKDMGLEPTQSPPAVSGV